jgi:hypothetical protein
MRGRFEAGSKSGSSEHFKALQKLIYVSDLVFGTQQASLCAQGSNPLCLICHVL